MQSIQPNLGGNALTSLTHNIAGMGGVSNDHLWNVVLFKHFISIIKGWFFRSRLKTNFLLTIVNSSDMRNMNNEIR